MSMHDSNTAFTILQTHCRKTCIEGLWTRGKAGEGAREEMTQELSAETVH